MFGFLKKLLGKKDPLSSYDNFTETEMSQFGEAKQAALEKVLGPIHNMVGHALIPFAVGGMLDMYRFPDATDGTIFATQELILPDGSGPKPGNIGTYELVSGTRHPVSDTPNEEDPFSEMEQRLCGLLSGIGHYSLQTRLHPNETCQLGPDDDDPCIIFSEWKKEGVPFVINGKEHGLLLVIEVFRSEMEYARKNGTPELIKRLKEKGHYPYSDLDRDPVA